MDNHNIGLYVSKRLHAFSVRVDQIFMQWLVKKSGCMQPSSDSKLFRFHNLQSRFRV
jgi:hypothetical protein